MSRVMIVFVGTISLVQAGYLVLMTLAGVGQYFLLINILQGKPLLVLTRVLYFAAPEYEPRINIGSVIDGMADQAYVLITSISTPTLRTFIINAIYLALGVVWFICSTLMLHSSHKGIVTPTVRFCWLVVTISTFITDLVVFVIYASDFFYTTTLEDLIIFSDNVLSGVGNVDYATGMVSWFMLLIFTRGAVLIPVNFIFFIYVLVHGKTAAVNSNLDESIAESQQKDHRTHEIPRAVLSRQPGMWSLRGKSNLDPKRPRGRSVSERELRPNERAMTSQNVNVDKNTTVNFPENLLSLPQRLENMIAEQQRKLELAMIDTSGRIKDIPAGARVTQSLPQLTETSESSTLGNNDTKSRRSTAAGLQGQLPWSYIPPTAHRMRDQLPPDEELPPVPVPDYTIHPSYRKASVFRAGSSVSTQLEKKEDNQNLGIKGVWRYKGLLPMEQ